MRLRNSVDILLFNPPYVPTIPEEAVDAQKDRDIQGSWAGGSDGMDVTNRFLEIVPVGILVIRLGEDFSQCFIGTTFPDWRSVSGGAQAKRRAWNPMQNEGAACAEE